MTNIQRAIQAACRALVEAEAWLTELDQAVGDGDLGVSLARGAKAVQEMLPLYRLYSPAEALRAAGSTFQRVVGGSSGPLYGAFLLRAASSLRTANTNDAAAWANATLEACEAISKLGNASPGDRTMLDALLPFAKTFAESLKQNYSPKDALQRGVLEAQKGAEATRDMLPRRGRSSYLGDRAIGYPDPGAMAVALWLRAVAPVV